MKKILIFWSRSKIAKEFIKNKKNDFIIYKTNRSLIKEKDTFFLDLELIENLQEFISLISWLKFDSILFFSSIYKKDDVDDIGTIYNQLNINCIKLINLVEKMIYNKNISNNWKILFFTDWWTIQPKPWFLWYTISKEILKTWIKWLAVKYPEFIFLWIDLWPVNTPKKWKEQKDFYNKSLIKIDNPTNGLINLLSFLINESNFYSTWMIIDFTWWTYLKRNYE